MSLNPADWLLHQDAALLVINKPAGLPTLVDGYHAEAPYVVGLLKAAFGPLWVVHRLDRDTSGVLLLARSAEAHRALNTQFEQHTTHKVYHALAAGSPSWETHSVTLALRPNGDRRHRTVIDARQGKPAHTELRVMQRFATPHGPISLIEARPRTGRTHQIRAHLAALGLPLLGDALYTRAANRTAAPPLIPRVALHAQALEIIHPSTGSPMRFTAPYPEDLASLLALLAG